MAKIQSDEEWKLRGSCRQADPALFFHPNGEHGKARRARTELAKAVCADCPVLATCRENALADRERYGVWGGLSEKEREAIWAGQRRTSRERAA